MFYRIHDSTPPPEYSQHSLAIGLLYLNALHFRLSSRLRSLATFLASVDAKDYKNSTRTDPPLQNRPHKKIRFFFYLWRARRSTHASSSDPRSGVAPSPFNLCDGTRQWRPLGSSQFQYSVSLIFASSNCIFPPSTVKDFATSLRKIRSSTNSRVPHAISLDFLHRRVRIPSHVLLRSPRRVKSTICRTTISKPI